MSSPAQVAKKFDRLSTNIQNMPRALAEGGALLVKKNVQNELRAIGLGPGKRMRNVGKRGARVGVRYDLYANSARVRMFGPAQLVEWDTRPHRIPRSLVGPRTRKRVNRKPINIPGVGWRQYAQHPGTRGRRPWGKGVNKSLPRIRQAGQEHLNQVMRQSFQGTAGALRRVF